MRSKNENVVSLKAAINRLIEVYKLKPGLNEAKLQSLWGEIVGKMIEKHTLSVYLKKSVLYISLDSAALKEELNYKKTELMDKINLKLGKGAVSKVVIS